jgi:hypothetical protein
VPLHSKLLALGFLDYVLAIHQAQGPAAWLFPELPDNVRGSIRGRKRFRDKSAIVVSNHQRLSTHFVGRNFEMMYLVARTCAGHLAALTLFFNSELPP